MGSEKKIDIISMSWCDSVSSKLHARSAENEKHVHPHCSLPLASVVAVHFPTSSKETKDARKASSTLQSCAAQSRGEPV